MILYERHNYDKEVSERKWTIALVLLDSHYEATGGSLYIRDMCVCASRSVVSDSLWPYRLYHMRLLYPWNSPGKNTGAIPPSRGTSQPRDWMRVSCTAGRFFTIWATREAHILGILASNWRRQPHPTPVLLPGKSHEQRSLVGCSPWSH